jgi:transcriptional regulator with XRE-family HTH domain
MPKDTSAHSQGTYDDRRIGQRLRHIRKSRRMSLQVVADLAGTSIATLSRIETGQIALDSRKLAVALADALRIAPSELTSLPVPAPANGNTDSSVEAVRQALRVVSAGWPDGEVQTVAQLRQRFEATEKTDWSSRSTLLPDLITDLHMTLDQRQEMSELLPLAVMIHTMTVRGWLGTARAPLDLRWNVALLGRRAAQEMNDSTWLGVATWGFTIELLGNSMFDRARRELDAITVPTASSQGMQLDGMLALSRSLVSAADGRPAESAAALDHAAELAGRTGQGDAFLMGFGPVNVGLWRMAAALESGEPDEAIKVAEALNPQEHPRRERRATYWMDYGRALTRVRRRDDAARALLRAEKLYPVRVLRNPFTRDTLVELLAHPPKDAALGRAIRRMAYRAGLPL